MNFAMTLASDAVVGAVSLTTLNEEEMLAVLEEARTRILAGRFAPEAVEEAFRIFTKDGKVWCYVSRERNEEEAKARVAFYKGHGIKAKMEKA